MHPFLHSSSSSSTRLQPRWCSGQPPLRRRQTSALQRALLFVVAVTAATAAHQATINIPCELHSWDDVLALEDELEDAEEDAGSSGPTPTRRRRPPKQLPMDALPKVAIVGRPNVGKSALFNRLTKTSKAIVYDYPGVTRDRLYTRAFWGNREFVVVDTGGLVSDADALARGEYLQEPLTSAGTKWMALTVVGVDRVLIGGQ